MQFPALNSNNSSDVYTIYWGQILRSPFSHGNAPASNSQVPHSVSDTPDSVSDTTNQSNTPTAKPSEHSAIPAHLIPLIRWSDHNPPKLTTYALPQMPINEDHSPRYKSIPSHYSSDVAADASSSLDIRTSTSTSTSTSISTDLPKETRVRVNITKVALEGFSSAIITSNAPSSLDKTASSSTHLPEDTNIASTTVEIALPIITQAERNSERSDRANITIDLAKPSKTVLHPGIKKLVRKNLTHNQTQQTGLTITDETEMLIRTKGAFASTRGRRKKPPYHSMMGVDFKMNPKDR